MVAKQLSIFLENKSHINADMRNARCVIGSLKEDEITRLRIRL